MDRDLLLAEAVREACRAAVMKAGAGIHRDREIIAECLGRHEYLDLPSLLARFRAEHPEGGEASGALVRAAESVVENGCLCEGEQGCVNCGDIEALDQALCEMKREPVTANGPPKPRAWGADEAIDKHEAAGTVGHFNDLVALCNQPDVDLLFYAVSETGKVFSFCEDDVRAGRTTYTTPPTDEPPPSSLPVETVRGMLAEMYDLARYDCGGPLLPGRAINRILSKPLPVVGTKACGKAAMADGWEPCTREVGHPGSCRSRPLRTDVKPGGG